MKKVLLFMAAAVMSVSITFAQADAKAAAKAAKEAAKALKAEIKAANKVLREAQGQLNAVDGNIDQANALIESAIENKHTASNPDTWYTAGKIQEKFYDAENEKFYLKRLENPEAKLDNPDRFYGSLSKMFDYYLKCDELEQLPDEKGKVVAKYRPEISEVLNRYRVNLVSGGIEFFNKDENEKAFEYFSKYIETSGAPVFESFNYMETDSLIPEIAYYATLAGLKLEDYNKALKFVDIAMKKDDVAQKAIEYKALSYFNLGDTANWVETLKLGVEKYPSVEYFYQNLISYYNEKDNTAELMAFADDMLAKNPLPIFRFVKGFVYQNMKELDKAIEEYKVCIEQNPNYTGAYRNLGICYCQKAQDLSDAMGNIDVKSKAYKAKKEEINAFYKLALPVYEKLRKIDDGTDPEVKNAWTNGLYTCYYMLNMGKEFEEIEKIMGL